MISILVVTLNPAIDNTYVIDRLVPGEVNRTAMVYSLPGGKGINVLRTFCLDAKAVLAYDNP